MEINPNNFTCPHKNQHWVCCDPNHGIVPYQMTSRVAAPSAPGSSSGHHLRIHMASHASSCLVSTVEVWVRVAGEGRS